LDQKAVLKIGNCILSGSRLFKVATLLSIGLLSGVEALTRYSYAQSDGDHLTKAPRQIASESSLMAEGAEGSPTAEGSLMAEGSELKQFELTATALQHLIAPGDAISLTVFGEPDLSVESVRVPEVGRVSFPLIGSVSVVGKTTSQVEVSVAKLLSQGYVRNPKLSVTISSYRPIFIRGAVDNTGAFPFSEGITIAKAIALAGGSKNSAKRQGVSILRDGKIIQDGLSIDSQQKILSGDIISVDEEIGGSDDQQLYIYIHGEVAEPGEYSYRSGLTVEKAIVLASGFSLRASKRKITVTRYAGVEDNQPPVKLKRVKLYTPIKPGDIIDVGASWF